MKKASIQKAIQDCLTHDDYVIWSPVKADGRNQLERINSLILYLQKARIKLDILNNTSLEENTIDRLIMTPNAFAILERLGAFSEATMKYPKEATTTVDMGITLANCEEIKIYVNGEYDLLDYILLCSRDTKRYSLIAITGLISTANRDGCRHFLPIKED